MEATPLPKPQGRTVAVGAQGRGRGGGNGGVWEGRPTIADEQGKEMDRGGEEAIREMEKQNNDQLVKKLGEQMNAMFSKLAVKRDEENRRLREENLAIKQQMVELEREKQQQNNRMEQLMAAILKQMGGDQPSQMQPASAEVTPVKSNKAAVVMPALPGSEGPASLEKRVRFAVEPEQQGAEAIAEMARHNQAMKEALKDMLGAEGGAGVAEFMQSKGHSAVVGMIESGGVLPPGAQ